MAQTVVSADPTVAALQESVRHNEKNIDKLDRDLKDFRTEVLTQFQKVDDRFAQLETKVDDRFAQLEAKVDDRFVQLETKFDQKFEKVDQQFEKVDQKLDKINDRFNQTNMLLVTIVGLVVALIVKLVVFD